MQRSFARVRGAPESVLGPENREAWEPGGQLGRLGASHGASGAPGSQPGCQHSSQSLASLGIPGAPWASLGREAPNPEPALEMDQLKKDYRRIRSSRDERA